MIFTATTSANGNINLQSLLDTQKYTVIAVSARKTSDASQIAVCMPYMYNGNATGRICGLHCVAETAATSAIANTSLTGVLFYVEA